MISKIFRRTVTLLALSLAAAGCGAADDPDAWADGGVSADGGARDDSEQNAARLDEGDDDGTGTSVEAVRVSPCVWITRHTATIVNGAGAASRHEYIHHELWVRNGCRSTRRIGVRLKWFPDLGCQPIGAGRSRMYWWDVAAGIPTQGEVQGLKQCP